MGRGQINAPAVKEGLEQGLEQPLPTWGRGEWDKGSVHPGAGGVGSGVGGEGQLPPLHAAGPGAARVMAYPVASAAAPGTCPGGHCGGHVPPDPRRAGGAGAASCYTWGECSRAGRGGYVVLLLVQPGCSGCGMELLCCLWMGATPPFLHPPDESWLHPTPTLPQLGEWQEAWGGRHVSPNWERAGDRAGAMGGLQPPGNLP